MKSFKFGDWALMPQLGAAGWLYGFMQSGNLMQWGESYAGRMHPRTFSGWRVASVSTVMAYFISYHQSKLRLQGWLENGNGKAQP